MCPTNGSAEISPAKMSTFRFDSQHEAGVTAFIPSIVVSFHTHQSCPERVLVYITDVLRCVDIKSVS